MSNERLNELAGLAEEQAMDQPRAQSSPPAIVPEQQDSVMLELVRRRRDELRAELRQIQDGERPVTGADSRSRVDRFFTRRLDVQQSEGRRGVANEDDVDEHRPEQVTIEVQGLLQRRSVSSFLSSSRFRRSLENSIRRGVTGALNSQAQTQTTQQPRPTPVTSTPSASGQSQAREQASSEPSRLPSVPEATSAGGLMRASIGRQTPTTPRSNEETFRELQHEEFVMEISELIHRQIVSNTLGTEATRRRLENVARAGVSQIGEESARLATEALRQLPPSGIIRNDFSHLGIQSGVIDNLGDLDDAVSVISATASATIPFSQTNQAVNREISSLKSQIAELTSLVRMSLNVQADIQRSIRQEVSAAINQHEINAGPTHLRVQSRLHADSKCLICLDTVADSVLYRCGHLCTCFNCATRLKEGHSQTTGCPVCRAPIVDIMRVYKIEAE